MRIYATLRKLSYSVSHYSLNRIYYTVFTTLNQIHFSERPEYTVALLSTQHSLKDILYSNYPKDSRSNFLLRCGVSALLIQQNLLYSVQVTHSSQNFDTQPTLRTSQPFLASSCSLTVRIYYTPISLLNQDHFFRVPKPVRFQALSHCLSIYYTGPD